MKNPIRLCTVFILISCVILSNPHPAPAPQIKDGWPSFFSTALGIKPDTEPKTGEVVTHVTATIMDPAKLADLGLKSEKGDRIKMINMGNGEWKIHNLSRSALTIYVGIPD